MGTAQGGGPQYHNKMPICATPHALACWMSTNSPQHVLMLSPQRRNWMRNGLPSMQRDPSLGATLCRMHRRPSGKHGLAVSQFGSVLVVPIITSNHIQCQLMSHHNVPLWTTSPVGVGWGWHQAGKHSFASAPTTLSRA